VENKELVFILTNSYDTLVRSAGALQLAALKGAELIKNAEFEVRSIA
jgi:hypothetical protein